MERATDIKHGSDGSLTQGRGGRADNFLALQAQGVHTRQARDLLSLSGTLGFKMAGRSRPARKIPTPALLIIESFINPQKDGTKKR